MYLFRVSKQSISALTPEVLKVIIESLHHFIKVTYQCQQINNNGNKYYRKFLFGGIIPNALERRMGNILRSENTVGEFHVYKGAHSIVNAKYNFVYVNIGCQGRISDRVFRNTDFAKRLENGTLNLQCDEPLPGREKAMPYVGHGSRLSFNSPYHEALSNQFDQRVSKESQ
nr:unnamed protein product [Callosobruchus analis]